MKASTACAGVQRWEAIIDVIISVVRLDFDVTAPSGAMVNVAWTVPSVSMTAKR